MKMNIKILIAVLLLILAGCKQQNNEQASVQAKAKIYYCPMHPQVTSDKPGVCPICQMDLVLKTDDSESKEETTNIIKLSEGKQILANVKTVKVEYEKGVKEIKSFGYIDFAEPGKRTITARFNGRIEKLYINKVGDIVKQGTPLFEAYSPDIVQAENEFVISINDRDNSSLTSGIEKKLLLLGLTKVQVEELKKTKEIKTTFTYCSPFEGTVIEKKIQEGSYFNEGTSLYEIADLSTIWNISEIFTDDIYYIKKGSQIKILTNAYPNQGFTGIVDFIYPVADQQNKTIKVRAVINNTGNKLKPNMFTEAYFNYDLGKIITIPAEAVIITGMKNIVWIKKSDKEFEMREIKLGAKIDGKYQVIAGLNAGDEVAASGGYLIDSENQLRSGDLKPVSSSNPPISFTTPDNKKIWNTICPVMGNPVDPKAPTYEYKGKLFGFCCAGCDEKFKKDPEKYLVNLNKDGNKFIGKTN